MGDSSKGPFGIQASPSAWTTFLKTVPQSEPLPAQPAPLPPLFRGCQTLHGSLEGVPAYAYCLLLSCTDISLMNLLDVYPCPGCFSGGGTNTGSIGVGGLA